MSNSLTFCGRLAENPEIRGRDNNVCSFRLIRNEYAGSGEDGQRQERVVSLQFTALGAAVKAISKARKGDQLFVTARIENNNYTDAENRQHYGFNFILDSFEFGAPGAATRAALADAAQ
jgi:single-strand DNA-binding protein